MLDIDPSAEPISGVLGDEQFCGFCHAFRGWLEFGAALEAALRELPFATSVQGDAPRPTTKTELIRSNYARQGAS